MSQGSRVLVGKLPVESEWFRSGESQHHKTVKEKVQQVFLAT